MTRKVIHVALDGVTGRMGYRHLLAISRGRPLYDHDRAGRGEPDLGGPRAGQLSVRPGTQSLALVRNVHVTYGLRGRRRSWLAWTVRWAADGHDGTYRSTESG